MDELKNLLFLAPRPDQRNIATLAASAGFTVTLIDRLEDALSYYPHAANILFVPEQLIITNAGIYDGFVSSAYSEFTRVVYDSDINEETEVQYLKQNISEVLSKNTGIDLYLRALTALNSGEKWYSRQALAAAVDSISFSRSAAGQHTHLSIHSNLSLKEKVTLELLSQGLTNQEIAEEMRISENTVKAHISSLYRKTNCRNRVELTKLSKS